MDRIGDESVEQGDSSKSEAMMQMGGEIDPVLMSSSMFLDHVGEVLLTLTPDKLSWKLVQPIENELNASSCLGIKLVSKVETEIRISDVYAVEYINWGLIHESLVATAGSCFQGRDSEMHRLTVYGSQRSSGKRSLWVLAAYTFGHMDLETCQTWVNQINSLLALEVGRPKSLLVFVHPLSGKGNGSRTWGAVAPIFSRAKVKTKVVVTQRAGHAFDLMVSIKDNELNSYDGVIAVGGDGFFNEILNGLLSLKHKAPYPPTPTELSSSSENNGTTCVSERGERTSEASDQYEDEDPLLQSAGPSTPDLSDIRTDVGTFDKDQGSTFVFPNERFRFGIIPAGSTDAIVICTTGFRDPVTSALQIVLGKRVYLDIAQVVRWKTTPSSNCAPYVRYAASFAGYGFYGDVIKDSEKYRWMGPKRYDYAGTKVFLKHRSYEAEIAYLEDKNESVDPVPTKGPSHSGPRPLLNSWVRTKKADRVICRMNCRICNEPTEANHAMTVNPTETQSVHLEDQKWVRFKGRFLSIGAAVISCRNERAPDGLVADAHLADGFLHLVLIKDCPRAFYLWHLTELARKGGTPLDFEFVEHFKTRAFTFTSVGEQGVWNLDGELLQAHQLSAQIFRGLITLFASGPEV